MPYIGILTFEGSFSSTISPILDFRYHKNIISLNKLPTPGFANCRHFGLDKDPTRDGWIKEFIKRKRNSGLFWAVRAAEKITP